MKQLADLSAEEHRAWMRGLMAFIDATLPDGSRDNGRCHCAVVLFDSDGQVVVRSTLGEVSQRQADLMFALLTCGEIT